MVGENPTNPVLDTPKKIALAKWASVVLRGTRNAVGLSNQVRSTRGGIRWDLDLAEGIDFSIYLLGAFEPRLIRAYGRLIRPGACVVDIGANIGAHTLHFARLVGERGKVVAYEPTGYAFRKLVANLALNPSLAEVVTPLQVALVSSQGAKLATNLVSSWPLDARVKDGPRALGSLHDTVGAAALTLDESLRQLGVMSTVDFVKLDVDGNELAVLRGAESLMRERRPLLFLELAPYEYRDPDDFDTMVEMLWNLGYDFCVAGMATKLPRSTRELHARIPALGSVNVIATPNR
jgi:FkbM family methyltransferase